jgi:hypothetical protein
MTTHTNQVAKQAKMNNKMEREPQRGPVGRAKGFESSFNMLLQNWMHVSKLD